ncbi:12378_t:CDS:2, partial [Racocetra persica]
KSQLTERISKKTKYPQTQISRIIDEFLEETKKSLLKGEEVRLQGYFTLKTTITKPRMAMNLQTKKKMKVPAKRVSKCKFSTSPKEEIKEGKQINFTVEEGKQGANLLVDFVIENFLFLLFILLFGDRDSLAEQVKRPKKVSNIMVTNNKLKQLNLNPLSVAKYFWEKGIEDMAITQHLVYFTYLEAMKQGYLLFTEEWQA